MLRSVRIQNFKSFQDATIKLGQRNFLIGPNMAGKSNVFEVFRLLRRLFFPEGGVYGLANAFTGGFTEYTWKGGSSRLIVITLEGTEADLGDWTYEISVAGDDRGFSAIQDERLSLSVQGRSHELIAKRNGSRTLLSRDGREVMQNIDASRAALEWEPPGWDGAFLRRSVVSWRFHRLIPHLMRKPNPAAAPPFLTETGDNLSSWLMHLQTKYSFEFSKVQQVCRDVLPGLVSLFTSPTQQSTVSVASKEQHLKRPVSLWEMSDGELAFVALLSLIFSPRELGAALYCIEEPENYLHPRLIETLMLLLQQVRDDPEASGSAQVIATTHSPQLVDRLSLDELIVVQKRDGATTVTYPRDKAHLRELLKNEELGLGDLFYSGALQGE